MLLEHSIKELLVMSLDELQQNFPTLPKKTLKVRQFIDTLSYFLQMFNSFCILDNRLQCRPLVDCNNFVSEPLLRIQEKDDSALNLQSSLFTHNEQHLSTCNSTSSISFSQLPVVSTVELNDSLLSEDNNHVICLPDSPHHSCDLFTSNGIYDISSSLKRKPLKVLDLGFESRCDFVPLSVDDRPCAVTSTNNKRKLTNEQCDQQNVEVHN